MFLSPWSELKRNTQYLLLNFFSSVSLKLIWNCKLFPDLCCSLLQLSTSYTTQSFKWGDEMRVGWKQPFWNVVQHKQPPPARLLHPGRCFCHCYPSLSCLFTCLPLSAVLLYVSVPFSLSRFHKESLPDLDGSAAGDGRDHLCFSFLVRHHHSREFLPKRQASMTATYQSFHL